MEFGFISVVFWIIYRGSTSAKIFLQTVKISADKRTICEQLYEILQENADLRGNAALRYSQRETSYSVMW